MCKHLQALQEVAKVFITSLLSPVEYLITFLPLSFFPILSSRLSPSASLLPSPPSPLLLPPSSLPSLSRLPYVPSKQLLGDLKKVLIDVGARIEYIYHYIFISYYSSSCIVGTLLSHTQR